MVLTALRPMEMETGAVVVDVATSAAGATGAVAAAAVTEKNQRRPAPELAAPPAGAPA